MAVCKGNLIKVYVNGEPVTEYIDDNPLKNGRIELETLGDGEVYYDDILVKELDYLKEIKHHEQVIYCNI